MDFKEYPAERLLIDSISSRLTTDEDSFRKILMNYTIDNNGPFNINYEPSAELAGFDVPGMIEKLREKQAAVIDGGGNVNFIYPVSALPTHHKVYLQDGRSLSAMCAIDAMGVAFTLRQDIKVASKCSECGELIYIQIRNGQIVELSPDTTHALHVDLNQVDNWSGSC